MVTAVAHRPAADYGLLNTASWNLIDLEKINRHWPDILRIAASMHAGEMAAPTRRVEQA